MAWHTVNSIVILYLDHLMNGLSSPHFLINYYITLSNARIRTASKLAEHYGIGK